MYFVSVGLFLLAIPYILAEEETSTYSTIEPEDLLSTFDQFYDTVDKITFDSDLTHFVPTRDGPTTSESVSKSVSVSASTSVSVPEGKKNRSRRTTNKRAARPSPAQRTPTTLSSTEEDEKHYETANLPEDTAPHLYDQPEPWTVAPRIKSFTGNYTRNQKYPQKQVYGNFTPPFNDDNYKNYQKMFTSPTWMKPNEGYGQHQHNQFHQPYPGAPQQAPYYGPHEGPPQQGQYYGPPQQGPYCGPPQGPPQQGQPTPSPQPGLPTSPPPAGSPASQISTGGQQPEPLLSKQIELNQIQNDGQRQNYGPPPRRFYRGRFSDQHVPGHPNRTHFIDNYPRMHRRRFGGFRRWPHPRFQQPYWPHDPPYPQGGYWPGGHQGQGPYPAPMPPPQQPQFMPTPIRTIIPSPYPLAPSLPPQQQHHHQQQQNRFQPPRPPLPQQHVPTQMSPPPPPPPPLPLFQRGGFNPYAPQTPPVQVPPYGPTPGPYPDPRYQNYQPHVPQYPPQQQNAPQYPPGPYNSNPNLPPGQNQPNPQGHQRGFNNGNHPFQYPLQDPKVNRQRYNENNTPPPNPNQQPNT